MSVQAISAALAVPNLKPSEKLLLVVLANYANEDFVCWPSLARLVRDTCLSKRGIINAFQGLAGKGLVERRDRGRKANGARTSFESKLLLHGALSAPRPTSLSAASAPDMVHSVQNDGAVSAPKPSIEPKEEPSTRVRARDPGARAPALEGVIATLRKPVLRSTPKETPAEMAARIRKLAG